MTVLKRKKKKQLKDILMRMWFITVLAAIFIGCSSRPDGVLNRKEMTRLLIDLHKADGIIYVAGKQYGYSEEKTICYQNVLNKYHVSQAQFDSSLVWYTANPKIFEKIYIDVIAELEEEIAMTKVPPEIPKDVTCPSKSYWDGMCALRIDTLPDTPKRWIYLMLDSCSYMDVFKDTTALLAPLSNTVTIQDSTANEQNKSLRKFIVK